MYRHRFDVRDRQALLHTEGEADFLLGDLETARQEDASELFKAIPKAKVESDSVTMCHCRVPFSL